MGENMGVSKVFVMVSAEEFVHDKLICFVNFEGEPVVGDGRYAILCIITYDNDTYLFDDALRVSKYKIR